jgi:hydrogenase maturation protease
MRTLVAGFGNVLRGDDGFGVEVIRRLADMGIESAEVALLDVGTGGIHLAQALLSPYDQVVVVDAVSLGSAPGTISVRAIEGVTRITEIDMHLAIPSRALALAEALGGLPPRVFLVGCEPERDTLEELVIGLSAPVAAAVDQALVQVNRLIQGDEVARA